MIQHRSALHRTAPWRRVLAIAAVAGAAATATAPTVTAHAAPAPAGRVSVYPGTSSVVHPESSTSPRATSPTAATRQRGSLPTRSAHRSASAAGQAPPATAAAAAGAATLRHSFNGVSSLDSAQANFGAEFEPPDPGLCEGNGFVLEPVNSAYRVYTTGGRSLIGAYNINDIFNEGAAEFTSDPRCYYDAQNQRWFVIVLYLSGGGAGNSSRVDIAVSTTSDPTKAWTQYRIDTTNPRGNGCPCFGDQPLLGVDQYNLYISTNEFSILGPQFNGAQIYAVDKAGLLASTVAPVVHFANLTIGGTQAASVQPATTNNEPVDAEYFLNSLDPTSTSDNRVGVWAITDRNQAKEAPVLSSTLITSEAYAYPVRAAQKGATSRLDAGDDRMQQTQYIGGAIWGELDTALSIGGDAATRDGAAWFKVKPTLNGDRISGAAIAGQGYVAAKGDYLLYPALAADEAGNAAMVFTLTGANHYPSAAYALLGSGPVQVFGQPVIAAAGSGRYDPTARRWGDYSYALFDRQSDSVWLVTEYVPPKSSQTTDGRRNWGTRVLEVALP